MIVHAIMRAPTEHVVRFLLTSYMALRAHDHNGDGKTRVVKAAVERLSHFRRPWPADLQTRRRVFGV